MILTLFSCEMDECVDEQYLIFGEFYGECQGDDCVKTFKLTKTHLYRDTKKQYGASDFNFKEMNADLFEKVEGLESHLPLELLNENETIGCPDCLDQGGYYIEFVHEGHVYNWRVDKIRDATPAYLANFLDRIDNSMAAID